MAKEKIKPVEGKVKARVLRACALGECDDVVLVDEAELVAHAGALDSNPDAVAYAESLRA